MTLRVFVETSDKYLWTLKPFAYLFNTYWSAQQPVVVFGYTPPDFPLPPNFTFYSIDQPGYPPERWTNGLNKFLDSQPDDHCVIMFCDYWLCRTVDHNGVRTLSEYCQERPNVIRMDLTSDRLFAYGDSRNAKDFESYGHYDIIQTTPGTQYQVSFQAAIWNRRLLRKLIPDGMTPWQTEIYLTTPDDQLVLGTRQQPVKYANVILKGKVLNEEVNRIPEPHRSLVLNMIPIGWQTEVP